MHQLSSISFYYSVRKFLIYHCKGTVINESINLNIQHKIAITEVNDTNKADLDIGHDRLRIQKILAKKHEPMRQYLASIT